MKRVCHLLLFFLLVISCEKGPYSDFSATGEIQLNSLHKVILTRDGGLLIAGESEAKITFIKTDENFNITWQTSDYSWGNNVYGSWGSTTHNCMISNIFQLENGNYICFGSVTEGGCVIFYSTLIVELSPEGKELRKLEIIDFDVRDAIETKDGGYLLYGSSATKLNSNMEPEWNLNNWSYNWSILKIINAQNNCYAAICKYGNDSYLRMLDKDGNEIRTTKFAYNHPPMEEIGLGIIGMKDNGFIITGRSRNGGPLFDMDFGMTRINDTGEKVWSAKFGTSSNEWLEDFVYSSDNVFVSIGNVGFPNESVRKTFLLKINQDGKILDSCSVGRIESLLYAGHNYFIT